MNDGSASAFRAAAELPDREDDRLRRFELNGPTMQIDAETKDQARQRYLDLLDADEIDCVEIV